MLKGREPRLDPIRDQLQLGLQQPGLHILASALERLRDLRGCPLNVALDQCDLSDAPQCGRIVRMLVEYRTEGAPGLVDSLGAQLGESPELQDRGVLRDRRLVFGDIYRPSVVTLYEQGLHPQQLELRVLETE